MNRREFLQVSASGVLLTTSSTSESMTSRLNLSQQGWWMKEPIRWVQTNLRETDAGLNANRLVGQLAEMHANVLLINMGGIASFYPTHVKFQYTSPYLPPGRDMFGDVLKAAHARGIRVVGRFDFSKTQKFVFDAHPEWFFVKADGEPVIYNGLYSTCINRDYYHVEALKIVSEALDGYDVDGLFFNMFGNQSRDYSGNYVGLCHCPSCRKGYWQMFHKPIPDKADDDYRRFMFVSSNEVAVAVGGIIHNTRPNAGYFNYSQEYTDGIMSESNTSVSRPLPQWLYSASDNVNHARNSRPDKASINLCMQSVDLRWRFAAVPQQEIALRLWEAVANGGAAAFAVNGTLDQQDRQALDTVRPIFRWLAENEQYYSGEQSAARVLLLKGPPNSGRSYNEASYRGVFRLLSEQHVPFAVSEDLNSVGQRKFALVIATDWAPSEVGHYAESGGQLLIVSAREPEFQVAPVVQRWDDLEGYFRIRNHARFPSLSDTDLMVLNGPYTELPSDPSAPLTLIPPSMIGPPELVSIDMKETYKPGIVIQKHGKGTIAWIPWDLGALYYRNSLSAHAGLFRDVLDLLAPNVKQLRTNAHPLIEMTLMTQTDRKLLHLINLSGHSETGYFAPIPMHNIQIRVAGEFKVAKSIRLPGDLPTTIDDGYTRFVVPHLSDYELVVLA